MSPLEMLATGFAVGLTGALAPGPMLFATIDLSLKKGWKSGPAIVAGHALIELAICALIVLGLASVVSGTGQALISLAGGAVLCVFGYRTIRASGEAALSARSTGENPIAAGMITSASNPYFWLWWLTSGSALIILGLETGIIAAALFVIGHWIADIGGYSAISLSFASGRALLSQRAYRIVLLCCGVFLLLFGVWFAVYSLQALKSMHVL
ncbi:MAG TPA: LysE family transporter [Candidatus Methanoperedenaceae archaeon]|nr:LysE family transporter [Candidatus Methanoperedenaceae archaeon]